MWLLPLVLIAAWIMPAFFDLLGVSWSDRTWRMYAATAGGWLVLEAPLIACLIVCLWKRKNECPIQPPQRDVSGRPFSADSPASETPSSLGPRG
jgi:hypothetical protein